MKKLTKETQIATISHHEILGPIEGIVVELSGEPGYLGKALTYGQIINGLLLLVLDHPKGDQLRLCQQAIDRLETWAIDSESGSKLSKRKGHPVTITKLQSEEKSGRGSRE